MSILLINKYHERMLNFKGKIKSTWFLTLFVFLFFFPISSNVYGQKTINDLGIKIFNAFKNDSIENIYHLKPNSNQLERYMDSLGIDKNSLSIKNIDEMNRELIQELQVLCEAIHNDSLKFNLSWSNALFEKINSKELKGMLGSSNAKGKVIIFTLAEIQFSSNDQHFILDIGDINKIDGVWKLGGGNLRLRLK
jgi:hypothetical protein